MADPVFELETHAAPDQTVHTEALLLAQKEALLLNSGRDLEADGRVREHGRHQKFRDHVNIATLFLFWIIVGCVIVGVLAFAWHMVMPKCWHYLENNQLDQLKAMLGAAVLSSALTGYASKRMN